MWAERSTFQIATNYGHRREILECLATQHTTDLEYSSRQKRLVEGIIPIPPQIGCATWG